MRRTVFSPVLYHFKDEHRLLLRSIRENRRQFTFEMHPRRRHYLGDRTDNVDMDQLLEGWFSFRYSASAPEMISISSLVMPA